MTVAVSRLSILATATIGVLSLIGSNGDKFRASAFLPHLALRRIPRGGTRKENGRPFHSLPVKDDTADGSSSVTPDVEELFNSFASLLLKKQAEIIQRLELAESSSGSGDTDGAKFSNDPWGNFGKNVSSPNTSSGNAAGGITRVIQGGNIIEKGAVSVTILRKGILTSERAKTIRDRNSKDHALGMDPKEGDEYSAAALSLVLHTKSPMVPTFRSDVRLFWVRSATEEGRSVSAAWFGGGADLTPYYLFDEDIGEFHEDCRGLCASNGMDYDKMKDDCDSYFYLPAREEHRGTGGLFFDDMMISQDSSKFVEGLVNLWMPSWLRIVEKRNDLEYSHQQREWQLLRRGRYLEFNLLYDRGVKFGLVGRNPRVEGVMVSAPPLIAWEYNHKIEEGSEEERLMAILKKPKKWVE